MWKDVYADFTDLPKHEQQKLFNLIKEEFFSDEEEEMKDALTAIRETRFNKGLACVHCGSVKVKRNGKYRNRQRYLCRDCGKSFNDLTNTPISGTRYLGMSCKKGIKMKAVLNQCCQTINTQPHIRISAGNVNL